MYNQLLPWYVRGKSVSKYPSNALETHVSDTAASCMTDCDCWEIIIWPIQLKMQSEYVAIAEEMKRNEHISICLSQFSNGRWKMEEEILAIHNIRVDHKSHAIEQQPSHKL